MESNNITIPRDGAAIRLYGTDGDGHCLFRALTEAHGQRLSMEEIWALRRLISETVSNMSDRQFENEMSVAEQILAESEDGVDAYCKKMATTAAFGGPIEVMAYVEEKAGACSVRLWTERSLDGVDVLQELQHYHPPAGSADAKIIELLWKDSGDAAADRDGADHFERFDWTGVRQPSLCPTPLAPPIHPHLPPSSLPSVLVPPLPTPLALPFHPQP